MPGKEKRQWQVDVTFLASSYRCIFGQGCPGVLTEPAPELIQGCCSYGAHASDKKDMRKIEKLAEELGDDEWQFRNRGLQRGVWKSVGKDDWRTRLVDGACVFLNRPGFATGPGLRVAPARRTARQALQRDQADGLLAAPVARGRPRGGGRVDDDDPHRVRPRRLGRGRRGVLLVVHRGEGGVHRRRARLQVDGVRAAAHARRRRVRAGRQVSRRPDGGGTHRRCRTRPKSP